MALKGVRIIELAGLAPAPFCGMILRDHGASVLRIDRPNTDANFDTLCRGKKSLILDFKKPNAASVLIKLCSKADVLIEPFRPGVMEKYHLGPTELCKKYPKLIYARMTGFGQNGPFSKMAGHDINYIAISGLLSVLGNSERLHHPINLLGDFAGGGLICALGICLALLNREKTGLGQVIDANMVEGSAYVSSWLWTTRHPNYPLSMWSQPRGENILDGGAAFYQTYKTKDNKFMAVGALEPQFFSALIKGLGLSEDEYSQFSDQEELKQKFQDIFLSKTQEEWCQIFDYTDACVTPVIPLDKAHEHKHNAENKSFVNDGPLFVPIPAPRLSSSPGKVSLIKPIPGEHTMEALQEAGYSKAEIDSLLKDKVVHTAMLKSNL